MARIAYAPLLDEHLKKDGGVDPEIRVRRWPGVSGAVVERGGACDGTSSDCRTPALRTFAGRHRAEISPLRPPTGPATEGAALWKFSWCRAWSGIARNTPQASGSVSWP